MNVAELALKHSQGEHSTQALMAMGADVLAAALKEVREQIAVYQDPAAYEWNHSAIAACERIAARLEGLRG
jgi:hypothetical protein